MKNGRKSERIATKENVRVKSVGGGISYPFTLVNLSPGGFLAIVWPWRLFLLSGRFFFLDALNMPLLMSCDERAA